MRVKSPWQFCAALWLSIGVVTSPAMAAQTQTDQADPAVIEDELREDERGIAKPGQRPNLIRPEAGRVAESGTVVAGAIRIEGAHALRPAAFAPVIEKYVARGLTTSDLRELATEVANVARRSGFGLATAWIPEQSLAGGVLRVVLDEGRIDAIEVAGDADGVVRSYLSKLAGGAPVRTAVLERQLLLAGDVPGIRIGKVRLVRKAGRNILIVNAVRDRVQARAHLDNWGSSEIGPVRARLSVDVNGLLADDDRLTIGGVVTPLSPKEFGLARMAYTKGIGTAGTSMTVGGYLARSKAGGDLADRDLEGRSAEAEAGIRHPLVRTRAASLWGGLDLRIRESTQTRADVTVREDRITSLAGSAFAFRQFRNGRIRARAALVQGLDLLGATEGGDPLASRSDADGVFSKLELWAEYKQDLTRNLSLVAEAEGQAASGPLLSSEEMGLGGRTFGRAWDYREFSGDRGVAGSLELRLDLPKIAPFSGTQVYAYADAGSVGNYQDGFGGGSLASAGGGLRIWLDRIEAGLELGLPLTDGADPDEKRDPRLSFTLGSRF